LLAPPIRPPARRAGIRCGVVKFADVARTRLRCSNAAMRAAKLRGHFRDKRKFSAALRSRVLTAKFGKRIIRKACSGFSKESCANDKAHEKEGEMPHAVTSDNIRLYFEEAGSGTPILFLHEFAADHTN